MIRYRAALAAVVAFSASTAVAQAYTEDQMTLAGQLGAVLALANKCTPGQVPMVGILKVIAENGLKPADVTGQTQFRVRMEEQAEAVNTMNQVLKQMGTSDREIRAEACKNLRANYGPDGVMIQGVVD